MDEERSLIESLWTPSLVLTVKPNVKYLKNENTKYGIKPFLNKYIHKNDDSETVVRRSTYR
jgi:hypothetical protein